MFKWIFRTSASLHGVFYLLITLIVSPWSWEMFSFNLVLLLLVWFSSIFLFLSVMKSSNKLFIIFCCFLLPLLITQWKTTYNARLNYMNVDDRYILTTRVNELPIFTIQKLNKTHSFNFGRYLENEQSYLLTKFEQNFFRTIDLNVYFFGNHPRERAGIREFEKFSFLFLPFFFFGLLRAIKLRTWQLFISLLIPLLELSIIGQDNTLGPFGLFPFFSVTIAMGLLHSVKTLLIILERRGNRLSNI